MREAISLDGWWHAWFDDEVDWRSEPPLGGPPPVPSVGWGRLEEAMESLPVPGTWEGARPAHHGVCWYWRPLAPPETWGSRLTHLRFGACRLRAEVYLDRVLVGRDLDGLTPFEIDLTGRVVPDRRHELAVRVTNPGGMGPGDSPAPIRWGAALLPPSHDVGGLWGSATLQSLPPLHLVGLTVTATSDLGAARVHIWVRNGSMEGTSAQRARLWATVCDSGGAQVGEARPVELAIAPGDTRRFTLDVPIVAAQPWTLAAPTLYTATVRLEMAVDERALAVDELSARFGLRTLRWKGEALYLNGQPLPLRLACSDGWYAGRAPAPDSRTVEREIAAARDLGLNALVIRDHVASPELLAAADLAGLLVWQLPDAQAALGPSADPSYAGLMRARRKRLVARDRNHPSALFGGPPLEQVCANERMAFGYADLTALSEHSAHWLPSGSEAAGWRRWEERLAADLVAHQMERVFTSPSGLLQSTTQVAYAHAARKVLAGRAAGAASITSVGRWADALGAPPGIMDTHRQAKGDLTPLQRALAPLALAIEGLDPVVSGGEGQLARIWALNEQGRRLTGNLQVALHGPDGRYALDETGWVSLWGRVRELVSEVPLAPQAEGEHVLQVWLRDDTRALCWAQYPLWVVAVAPQQIGELAIAGATDTVRAYLAREKVHWKPYVLQAPAKGLLVTDLSAEPGLANALYGGAIQRMALLLPDPPPQDDGIGWGALWPALRSARRTPREDQPHAPVLLGHRSSLTLRVGAPGVWWHATDDLWPRYVLADPAGGGLVSALYGEPGAGVLRGAPRLGTAMALARVGEAQVLYCALPLVERALEGSLLATRLMHEILAWLAE